MLTAAWIAGKLGAKQLPVSPCTGEPLEHQHLTPNRFMLSVMESLAPTAG